MCLCRIGDLLSVIYSQQFARYQFLSLTDNDDNYSSEIRNSHLSIMACCSWVKIFGLVVFSYKDL
jgi:hypothetical protein